MAFGSPVLPQTNGTSTVARKPHRRSTAPSRMLSMDEIFAVFKHSIPEVDRTPTFLSQRGPSQVSKETTHEADARKGRIMARAKDVVVRPAKEAFALIIPRYMSPQPAPNVKCDGWCVQTSATARSAARVVRSLLRASRIPMYIDM